MEKETYFKTAAIIFGIVALLHLWRSVASMPLILGMWELPFWLSYAAVALTAFMSYWGFKLAK